MRAEAVVFNHTTPVGVDHFRPVLAGTNTVHPVVLIGEASSRPAQVRDAYILKCIDHVVADAAGVGNR